MSHDQWLLLAQMSSCSSLSVLIGPSDQDASHEKASRRSREAFRSLRILP